MSIEGLNLTEKKYSDPEPHNDNSIMQRTPEYPYKQEYSKSIQPNALNSFKTFKEPSFITQATTSASGDQN